MTVNEGLLILDALASAFSHRGAFVRRYNNIELWSRGKETAIVCIAGPLSVMNE